jgi:septum formation protein
MFQKPDGPAIILASGSAIRRQLLGDAGVVFEWTAASVDEDSIKQSSQAEGVMPAETAMLLAELKAARIRAPGALVIGADQLLICEDHWFDKPRDRDDARAQLRFLRGKTHHLHTAMSVLKDGQVIWHHAAAPSLVMREFSDEFLEHYLNRELEQILHCVGGYRLEGPGAQLFDRITGDHTTILGLPLLPLLGFLRQHGALLK